MSRMACKSKRPMITSCRASAEMATRTDETSHKHFIGDIKMAKVKLNPLELVQGVFDGRPLMRNEMEALFSFAMDNLMDYDDMPEVFEKAFQDVLQRKMAHYAAFFIEEQAACHLAFCKNQE